MRHFDFKNATIQIAAVDEGGRSGPGVFHLKSGVGFVSDGPDPSQSHDWRVDLIADHVLHPDPLTWIRVIVLDKDHLTGTDDWHYVMAFNCANGSLVRLFQYGSEGVTVQHLDGQTLQLYQAIWAANDAHCCPSEHAELLYRWNAREHRYRRATVIRGQGFKSVPNEK